jgi:hypothetical protein
VSATNHAVYRVLFLTAFLAGRAVTDSVAITVSALSPGADVWVLLQRHITTFATALTTLAGLESDRSGGDDEDGTGISMALQLVESVGKVTSARHVWAKPSGAAVSTRDSVRSRKIAKKGESSIARIHFLYLDPRKSRHPVLSHPFADNLMWFPETRRLSINA